MKQLKLYCMDILLPVMPWPALHPCASLDLLLSDDTLNSVQRITKSHQKFVVEHKNNSVFESMNSLGTILSVSLKTHEGNSYFQQIRDQAYQYFLSNGFLIRPSWECCFCESSLLYYRC
jgi:adenosylmethionine-8-amino-7-oxononanoate aminotransferase